jgi:hypothetical protein
MSGDDGEAWRPRTIDPMWHVLFRTAALEFAPLPEGLLRQFSDYCEAMYLRGGNSLYALRTWTAYRQHGRPPPEWVMHHFDDVCLATWSLLNRPQGGTPNSDEIATAFGLGPRSGHFAELHRDPFDALIGFAVVRQMRKEPGKVEAAISSIAKRCKCSERKVWEVYQWYRSLPGN